MSPRPSAVTVRRTGTQSIERAALLLRELARKGKFGWRLTDLAGACGLHINTTRRILESLVRERLVQRRASDRHYLPGPLLLELTLSVPEFMAFPEACRSRLQKLARLAGGSAYLLLRSGAESVLVARAGETTFKGIPVGSRFPLVASAGGAAILIELRPAEADSIIDRNLRQLSAPRETRLRSIRRMLHRSASRGYGIDDGDIMPGVSAVAIALTTTDGAVFGAVGVAWLSEQFPADRLNEIVHALRTECATFQRQAECMLIAEE